MLILIIHIMLALRFYFQFLSLMITPIAFAWKCGADQHDKEPISIPRPHSRLRSLKTIPFTPLEIFYDFTTLDKQSILVNASDIENIKLMLRDAKDLFKSIINVKRQSEKLSLGSFQCDDQVEISPILQGEGVEADIIVFPFIDMNKTGNVLAYAATCINYEGYRTVAGFIGFPKVALEFNKENWRESYLLIVMHELTHVLVFNKRAFLNFVDKNDDPIKYNPKTTKTVNGIKRVLVSTPRVIEAARKHFNCPTLEGVELENQGGSGTVGSHWEARVMLNDYMIGIKYNDVVLSDITLALFEDSGWYTVNYYTGGLFRFGKDQGCSFLNTKCIVNEQSQFKEEFCTEHRKPFCTNTRLSKGVCYMFYDTSIPIEYQYFSDEEQGGFSIADYCPVSIVYSNEEKELNSHCDIGSIEYLEHGESISKSSLCFLSTLTKTDYNGSIEEMAICYAYKCDFEKGVVKVEVLGQTINCPPEGGSVTDAALKGSMTCPKFFNVCTTEISCHDVRSCIERKSASFLSKKGYDSLVDSMNKPPEDNTTSTDNANAICAYMSIALYCILFGII